MGDSGRRGPMMNMFNINDLSTTDETGSSSGGPKFHSDLPSVDPSTVFIEDGLNEDEFEQSIRDLAEKIHREMRTYGDVAPGAEEPNDLRTVEFRIQSERIVRLLDECVEHVRFAMLLPIILADGHENERVRAVIEKCTEGEQLMRLLELSHTMEMESDQMDQKGVIEDIYTEFDVCMRAAAKCGLNGLVPEYLDQLSSDAAMFVDMLSDFVEMSKLRIFWTAPKVMAKEKRLHTMWVENLETKHLVADMSVKVNAGQRRIAQRIETNETMMDEYHQKVAKLNAANDDRIEKLIYESNLKMNKTSVDSGHKQRELLDRANKAKEEYQTMLSDNLYAGKKLREHKSKTQQKLQAWLLKYDTEVGERSRELFELRDKLDDERVAFKKWMVLYEEQEVEYLDVEAQILAEFIRQRDEKVRIFTLHYAAKIVQRYFRRMLKRKKAMRKKGKKKGKK